MHLPAAIGPHGTGPSATAQTPLLHGIEDGPAQFLISVIIRNSTISAGQSRGRHDDSFWCMAMRPISPIYSGIQRINVTRQAGVS